MFLKLVSKVLSVISGVCFIKSRIARFRLKEDLRFLLFVICTRHCDSLSLNSAASFTTPRNLKPLACLFNCWNYVNILAYEFLEELIVKIVPKNFLGVFKTCIIDYQVVC